MLVPSSNVEQFITDISEQPIGPIFKGQASQSCLTPEDLNNRLSRNVGDYQPTLLKIPQRRRSHLHQGGSLLGFLLGLRDPDVEGTAMFQLTQRQAVPFQKTILERHSAKSLCETLISPYRTRCIQINRHDIWCVL
jgi:hypothetical protein